MTTVINLFAGPGAGKSTTAAGLFHVMKVEGMKAELVTEYAKDLTYSKRWGCRTNQVTMLGKQFERLWRLKDQVDWIVTDSPLLMQLAYLKGDFNRAWLGDAIRGSFRMFDNVNFRVMRDKPYQQLGRDQDEKAARRLDLAILNMLHNEGVHYLDVRGSASAPTNILHYLKEYPA
jgi:hypothetical protein